MTSIFIYNPSWEFENVAGVPIQNARLWPEDRCIPVGWERVIAQPDAVRMAQLEDRVFRLESTDLKPQIAEIDTRPGAINEVCPNCKQLVPPDYHGPVLSPLDALGEATARVLDDGMREREMERLFRDNSTMAALLRKCRVALEGHPSKVIDDLHDLLLSPSHRPEREADRQPSQDEAARHPEHGASPRADQPCGECGHRLDSHDQTVSHFHVPCVWPGCECHDFKVFVVPQDPHPIGDKAPDCASAVSSNAKIAEQESSAGTSPARAE